MKIRLNNLNELSVFLCSAYRTVHVNFKTNTFGVIAHVSCVVNKDLDSLWLHRKRTLFLSFPFAYPIAFFVEFGASMLVALHFATCLNADLKSQQTYSI